MSTRRTDYVMLAAKFKYSDFTEEQHEKLDDITDLDVVKDGMGGEWIFIGKIIAKSDEYAGFDKPIDVMSNISLIPIELRVALFTNKEPNLRYWVFTKWS